MAVNCQLSIVISKGFSDFIFLNIVRFISAYLLNRFRVQQTTNNNQQSTINKIHNCYLIETT
jgi:hypothetical protein